MNINKTKLLHNMKKIQTRKNSVNFIVFLANRKQNVDKKQTSIALTSGKVKNKNKIK